MSRRKVLSVKWTLAVLMCVCACALARPQEAASASSDKPTDKPTRYRYTHSILSIDKENVPVVISYVYQNGGNADKSRVRNLGVSSRNDNKTNVVGNHNGGFEVDHGIDLDENRNKSNRTSRLITKRKKINSLATTNKNKSENERRQQRPKKKPTKTVTNKLGLKIDSANTKNNVNKRTTIRKVITKWTDNAKVEGLRFVPDENSNQDQMSFGSTEDYATIEYEINESTETPKTSTLKPNSDHKQIVKINNKNRYRPRPENSEEEIHVHSNKVHIIEDYYNRPTYMPNTFILSTPYPTPIITNVGTPVSWNPYKNRKPTTPKPIRYVKPVKNQFNYHNAVHQIYPQYPDSYEVSTFNPVTAYTERIVIRPEEYAAPSADCPTIYLTLNNSFQGQGKEACPDLNIAVNTNVVNKNVVIESEEEAESDGLFPGGFGLALGEDSAAEDAAISEFSESDSDESRPEGQSASIENGELTNYNSLGSVDSDSSVGSSSANAPLAAISRPNRHKNKKPSKDKDAYGLSSMIDFFRPAVNVLGWISTLNPFSFSFLTLFLTPIVLFFAGATSFTAALAPIGIPFARESPQEIHVLKPQWHWDNEIKTWHLDDFDRRKWRPRWPKSSQEEDFGNSSVKPTLFLKVKQWMRETTNKLRKSHELRDTRKNKREKRQIWKIPIK